jgi:plastocyanin
MRRNRSLRFALIGGLFGLLLLAGPVAAVSSAAVRIGESNDRYHFKPGTTYVNVGGTVTWTNGSDAPHTVTSDTGTELSSANIGPATTFSHTFATIGTFAYHCSIHDYMVARVVVLAAGVTPPQTDTLADVPPVLDHATPGLVALVLAGLAGGALGWRRSRPAD